MIASMNETGHVINLALLSADEYRLLMTDLFPPVGSCFYCGAAGVFSCFATMGGHRHACPECVAFYLPGEPIGTTAGTCHLRRSPC